LPVFQVRLAIGINVVGADGARDVLASNVQFARYIADKIANALIAKYHRELLSAPAAIRRDSAAVLEDKRRGS
jgi:hypothetical protein